MADGPRPTARTRNPHTPVPALAVLHYRPTDARARVWDSKHKVTHDCRVIVHRPLEVVR